MINAIWDSGGSTSDVGAGFLSVGLHSELLLSLGRTARARALADKTQTGAREEGGRGAVGGGGSNQWREQKVS